MATPEEYGEKERLKAVLAVYLILISAGEILMLLRQNTGYQDGSWDVPSGHVEDGELPTEAVIREAKEEVGIELSPRYLTLVHTSYRPQHDATGNRIDLFFQAGRFGERAFNAEPEKCAAIRWFPIGELPKNIVPHVRHAIEKVLSLSHYSELSVDWLKREGLYKL